MMLEKNHPLFHASAVQIAERVPGITESSTDPPAVPLANPVDDAFGKRQPVGRCGGGSKDDWTRVGTG